MTHSQEAKRLLQEAMGAIKWSHVLGRLATPDEALRAIDAALSRPAAAVGREEVARLHNNARWTLGPPPDFDACESDRKYAYRLADAILALTSGEGWLVEAAEVRAWLQLEIDGAVMPPAKREMLQRAAALLPAPPAGREEG